MSLVDKLKDALRWVGRSAGSGLEDIGIPRVKNYMSYDRALNELADQRMVSVADELIRGGHVNLGSNPTLETFFSDPARVSTLRQQLKGLKAFQEEAAHNSAVREGLTGVGSLGVMGGTGYVAKKLIEGGEPKRASNWARAPKSEKTMTKTLRKRANAYKVGFIYKLAELGITPTDFAKMADGFFDVGLSSALGMGRDIAGVGAEVAGTGAKLLGEAALLAPLLVGGATGGAEALLSSPSVEDIESLRKAEIINLYRNLTNEARARMVKRHS